MSLDELLWLAFFTVAFEVGIYLRTGSYSARLLGMVLVFHVVGVALFFWPIRRLVVGMIRSAIDQEK
jgi:hypothetical protein